jgi:hypothetical protein
MRRGTATADGLALTVAALGIAGGFLILAARMKLRTPKPTPDPSPVVTPAASTEGNINTHLKFTSDRWPRSMAIRFPPDGSPLYIVNPAGVDIGELDSRGNLYLAGHVFERRDIP